MAFENVASWALRIAALTALTSFTISGISGCRQADPLDEDLSSILSDAGFTGEVDASLEKRLGRPVDAAKADLGRLLFFDKLQAIHDDSSAPGHGNSCAACH